MSEKLKNGLLALFSLLIFQELAFRISYPLPEVSNFDRSNYIAGADRGIRYTSFHNSNWYWKSIVDTNQKFVHRLNQYGFRDGEWKVEKPSGKKRILFLGDSFLEGVMAEQSETIPNSFRKQDQAEEYDLMNAGILGTGFHSYLKIVADAVPIFNPDIVYFVLYANDIASKAPIVPNGNLKPQFYQKLKPRALELYSQFKKGSPIPSRFGRDLNSFLPSMAEENFPWKNREQALLRSTNAEIRTAILHGELNPFLPDQILREKKGLEAKPNLRNAFEFLKEFSLQHKTKVVFCYIPARHQVSNYYYQFDREFCKTACPDHLDLTLPKFNTHQKYLKDLCAEFQMDFFDYTELVKRMEENQEHLYWNYDGHMKSKGYRLIGENIYHSIKVLE